MSETYDDGMRVRREVLGGAHVDRAVLGTTPFTEDFQELIISYAWGRVWTRPGLDRRSRSIAVLTAMIALGHCEEFAMHVRAARTTAEQGKSIAERAALSYVGATLVARDRVIETAGTVADTFGTRAKAEAELKKLQARYERRGTTARNQLERDVKKARTRVERELRLRRRDIERTTKPLADQAGLAAARVENTVQEGLLTGTKVASRVSEQAVRIA